MYRHALAMRRHAASLAALAAVAFLLAVVPAGAAAPPAVLGVHPMNRQRYEGAATFVCDDGKRTLPATRVNDDFCDCADGTDEPGTSACPHGTFWCLNRGHRGLSLPSSRVGDSICDCCDGSDEPVGACENTCKADAAEAQKETVAELAKVERGIEARKGLLARAAEIVAEREAKAAGLESEVEVKQAELKAAEEAAEEAERLEKAENERLEAEFKAKYGETGGEEAGEADDTGMVDAVYADEAEDGAAEPAGETDEAAFPYPQEYAFPGSEEDGDGAGDEAAFPYPQEYAFPGAGEDDSAGAEGEATEEGAEEPGEAVPEPAEEADPEDRRPVYEPYVSDDAVEKRKARESAKRESERVERELRELREKMEADLGEGNVLVVMQGECYSFEQKKYTYEVCPFAQARQKEGARSSGTKLGEFEGYDASKQEMSFTKGAKCWNGPNRSITVTLECGDEAKVVAVDEPATCVYTARMTTPVVCSEAHANALRMSLEFGGEEEDENY